MQGFISIAIAEHTLVCVLRVMQFEMNVPPCCNCRVLFSLQLQLQFSF